ncbi:MAG TPA: hypothetical protein VF557_15570 [Jatrophihabitans sp.]|uniref:hypothetical protein n=1 Tax=Jatrophihabitans sp. TaxID=1932789 RepID=UPI002EFEA225
MSRRHLENVVGWHDGGIQMPSRQKGRRAMALGMGGAFSGGSPNGPHYEIEVNKGATNVGKFQDAANKRFENGYRMAHVFEQNGNTICVWERFQ